MTRSKMVLSPFSTQRNLGKMSRGRRSRGAEALAALPDEHAPGRAPHFDAPLRIGTRVEAKFHAARGGTGWFEGTVVSCHEDERYDIDYDDGDFEARVLRKHIKLLEAQSQAADSLPSAPVAKRKAALTELTPQQHQQQKRQRARSKADAPKVALEDDSPAPNYQAAETLVVVKVEADSEKEAAEADADAEAALAASSEVSKLKAESEAPAGGAAEAEALEVGTAAAEEAPEPGRAAEAAVGRADTSSARPAWRRPRTTRLEPEPTRVEAGRAAEGAIGRRAR